MMVPEPMQEDLARTQEEILRENAEREPTPDEERAGGVVGDTEHAMDKEDTTEVEKPTSSDDLVSRT